MVRDLFENVDAVLFDLNGVLYVGDSAIDGGRKAIECVRSRGLPCRFTTNTTTSSLDALHKKLTNLGLPIEKEEIFSPAQAACVYLEHHFKNPTVHLIVADDTKKDFSAFPVAHTNPDAVIIGDIGDRWNYQIMNKLFEMITLGAQLVALHKSKYSQTTEGLHLDIGAFVAGLEYATGKDAVVIGKPSHSFFDAAREDLGVPAERMVMIGDDIDSDVGGAQNAGFRGVLVKTGKYRPELVARSKVQPDGVLESVAELVEILS